MKSQIYNQAEYYELAFSFINPQKQVDLFEEFIRKFSKIKVNSVLDIACGTALQLRELAKRGYISFGLDSSVNMLNYLAKEAAKNNLKISLIKADMANFKLERKVNFAYIMMGSIVYLKNNGLFLSHLNSLANSLNSGGLYIIENLAINWADPAFFKPQSWIMKQGGIKVKTTYQLLPKDPLKQIVTQIINMEVNDNGKNKRFADKDELKIVFPEELKLLVEKNGKFEFLGFFERNSAKALKKISSNNIVLLTSVALKKNIL